MGALALASCVAPRTQIVVAGDTDYTVPAEVGSLRVTVVDPGGGRELREGDHARGRGVAGMRGRADADEVLHSAHVFARAEGGAGLELAREHHG
jgi:hypothetical protein